jgi:hypothetical protein
LGNLILYIVEILLKFNENLITCMEISTAQSSSATESSSLSQSRGINTLEEMGIVIVAQDLTPTMISQDFLKFSGIVPKEWELSQQPLLNPAAAQLQYTNGVSILAQPRTITFSEALNNKALEDIVIPETVIRYVEKLPHTEYLGMSLNSKILVPFPQNPNAVSQYIIGRLLSEGAWKNIGRTPVQAGINLMYLLDHCQLTINISEARLQQAEQPPIAALLFSGSFNYNISGDLTAEAKVNQLKQSLSFWQTDLSNFRNIVMNQFLTVSNSASTYQGESVFPGL